MSIPADLQRPGIRWDNIKPIPFDVQLTVRPEERDKRGLAEIWQFAPQVSARHAIVLRMRDEGRSVGEIAVETGYGHTRIRAILKEHGRT